MSIDTRGFTYYKNDNYTEETWESNFSEYKVTCFHYIYAIGSKDDSFLFFNKESSAFVDLETALNTVRRKAINEFFGDDIF
jgi:hypothetical protein